MNILIITTYFVPDSAIAAVRPYMIAKHLSDMGEKVTVLRSGNFEKCPFDEYNLNISDFEIVSALGENCDAEKFKKGEYTFPENKSKLRYPMLPLPFRIILRFCRDCYRILLCRKPPRFLEEPFNILRHQKQMMREMSENQYDVIFATYGGIENISASLFAAELFNSKLIIDFRDPPFLRNEWNDICYNIYSKKLVTMALKKADCVTAVSNAINEKLRKYGSDVEFVTVHNGFDDTATIPEVTVKEDVFTICYTGTLYCDQKAALSILVRCIHELIDNGVIDEKHIQIHYAGMHFKEFCRPFKEYGRENLLINHGYLSKCDTQKLQMASDVFLVLSWNYRNSQGILTGKFYEGIQVGKPILAVVAGKLPDSELMQLQKQYQYGFCFEQAREKQMLPALKTFIEQLYCEKLEKGRLSYRPSEKLYKAFSYTGIVKKLHRIMEEIVTSEGIQQ